MSRHIHVNLLCQIFVMSLFIYMELVMIILIAYNWLLCARGNKMKLYFNAKDKLL